MFDNGKLLDFFVMRDNKVVTRRIVWLKPSGFECLSLTPCILLLITW